jgi:heterodisulfide reductase subunit C
VEDTVEIRQKTVKTVEPDFLIEVLMKGGKTVNLCWQCGLCTASCPSGAKTAFCIRKLIRRVQLGFENEVLPKDDLWMCTTCYTCHERCPRGVDVPEIIFTLRNMAVKRGYISEKHKKVASLLIETGQMVYLNEKVKLARKNLGLSEIPLTTLSDKKALEDIQKLMEITGFDRIMENENIRIKASSNKNKKIEVESKYGHGL